MQKIIDVIIVGGGVVGLSAAIAMHQRGFATLVLDAGELTVTSLPHSNSRVYAINNASQNIFEAIGVWGQLDKNRLSSYQQMHVWDGGSNACIDFDARLVGQDKLGFMLEESLIKQALLTRANELNIKLIANYKVAQVNSNPQQVTISDGVTEWCAKLLIVADGANSTTRELLEVPMTTWSYHQQAIVATVYTEKSHQRTAYQVFNADGPLAFLPMNDVHQCSIVWSTSPKRAEWLMSLSDEAFANELEIAFAAKLGQVKVITKRTRFPLQMRHVKQYSGANWLLMGDAAHTIHPLAGLGLNVGLADLAVWLKSFHDSTWSVRSLQAYQRQRKHALWQIIALMDGLNMLFTIPFPPITLLRRLGLNICNRLLPLKRLLIEHAAGTRFEVLSHF